MKYIKKISVLSLLFIFLLSALLYSENDITIARRMKILIADIDSEAGASAILNGKTIADELTKYIFESQTILEKVIPLKREDSADLSGLTPDNILKIIKRGQDFNVEGMIVGKAVKNDMGLYDIHVQLIDVQKKNIPSTRRVINYAEIKNVRETAESLSENAKNLITVLEKGNFPRVDIITPNFDIVSIIQINKDNFPEIKLSVSVVNNMGEPVSVQPDLFEIRENGNMVLANVQKVKSEGKIYIPITILLLIDRSPSMLEELDGKKTGQPFKRAKAAALEFIGKLAPNDRIKIVAFDREALSLGDYTADKNIYTEKLNELEVGIGTGLYNVLKYAVQDMSKIEGEKAIIFLTDGKNDVRGAGEEIKAVTLEDGLQIAKKFTIPVYTVGFGGADEKVLGQIARETHSMFFKAASSEKLMELYLKIHKIIENQYIISYTSLVDKTGKVAVSLNIKKDEREFSLTDEERNKALEYQKDVNLKKEIDKIDLKKKEIEKERLSVQKEKEKLESDMKALEGKKKDAELEKKNLELEKEKLAGLKSELSDKEKQVSGRETTLALQKEEADAKLKELENRKKGLDAQEKEYQQKKKEMEDADSRLKAKEQSLTVKESELRSEEQKLNLKTQELEKKKKQILQIEKNIRDTNTEMLNYLKEKMDYLNSEKEKLNELETSEEKSNQ